MPDKQPVHIVNDSAWEKGRARKDEEAGFGFESYAKTLAGIIARKDNKTPLVLGVYGPWGSGKTTLMRRIQGLLDSGDIKKAYPGYKDFRRCKTVWFQAWKHAEEDAILAALIEAVMNAMEHDGYFTQFKAGVDKLIQAFHPFKAFGKAVDTLAGCKVSGLFSQLRHKQQIGFYSDFEQFFERMVWGYARWAPPPSKQTPFDDEKGVMAVFIDDLDRCPEDRIVKVLETVKLFMDKTGCVFVIGADMKIIETALVNSRRYRPGDAARFMEKIVQVPYSLPYAYKEDDFSVYVEQACTLPGGAVLMSAGAVIRRLTPILKAVQHNPRQMKRFLNNTHVLQGLLAASGVDMDFTHVIYWTAFQLCFPDLAEDLVKDVENDHYTEADKSILRKIIQCAKKIEEARTKGGTEPEGGGPLDDLQEGLKRYLDPPELVPILAGFDITPEEFLRLVSFSTMTREPELEPEPKPDRPRVRTGEFDAMAPVEAGPFKYQDDRDEVIEHPYEIGVYPVTNSQFEEFVRAGGYSKEEFWTIKGWKWREKEDVTQPRFWNDKNWNQPDHPVVGVSWFEAAAFCAWLEASRKDGWHYALPAEKQWERAARGADGREYPWGNEFDKDKCNTRESGIGQTTRVDRYHQGVSPAGCYDMAGNVWEWTRTEYGTGEDREDFDLQAKGEQSPVVRGGSWDYVRGVARCAFRSRFDPFVRNFYVGFRCLRTQN